MAEAAAVVVGCRVAAAPLPDLFSRPHHDSCRMQKNICTHWIERETSVCLSAAVSPFDGVHQHSCCGGGIMQERKRGEMCGGERSVALQDKQTSRCKRRKQSGRRGEGRRGGEKRGEGR